MIAREELTRAGVRLRQARRRPGVGAHCHPCGDRGTRLGARGAHHRPHPGLCVRVSDGYHFLSNYADLKARYDGEIYPTGEHAFAATKTLDLNERIEVANTASPSAVKGHGRSVTLRPDWDTRVRYEAMYETARSKAGLESYFRNMLLRTQTTCSSSGTSGTTRCGAGATASATDPGVARTTSAGP